MYLYRSTGTKYVLLIEVFVSLYRERGQLRRALDRAQTELAEARGKAEDLRASRQEAARELLALQTTQQQAAHSAQLDRRDEAVQRDSLDRRLAGLRAEVGAIASGLSPHSTRLSSDIEVKPTSLCCSLSMWDFA